MTDRIFKEIDFFLVEGSYEISNTIRVHKFMRELVSEGFIKGFIDNKTCREYVSKKFYSEDFIELDHQFKVIHIDWKNNKLVTEWDRGIEPPVELDTLTCALAYTGNYGKLQDVAGFYLVDKEYNKDVYWCPERRGTVSKHDISKMSEWVYTKPTVEIKL